MKKRIFSLLMILCLVVWLCPTVFAATLDSGLVYVIVNDHVEITRYTGSTTEVVIPSEIKGLPVTIIDDNAFNGCSKLTSVTIPNSVTSIGDQAFSGCDSLANITIPEGVTSIGNTAFAGCDSLTSVIIPSSVINIYRWAFTLCSNLTDFQVSANNSAYSSQNGILYNKDATKLVCFPGGKSGHIVIRDGVATIGDAAFSNCHGLTSITIPDSVTCIDYCAFSSCYNLTNINIPDSVTSIRDWAFSGCSSLTSISIPDSVTSICDSTFRKCLGLTSIAIPDSITSIGDWAFSKCSKLTDVYYFGSEADWAAISIGSNNEELTNATIHFNSKMPSPFTDVPESSFFEEPVQWAIEYRITNGLTTETFGPTDTCNRAQVVTFLWRAAGCPEPTITNNPFLDVPPNSFYEKPVLWAVEKGITNGSDTTHFNPNGVCNRAQVVTFLYRAFESPAVFTGDLPFTDILAGAWYEAPITWAVENGITNGVSATEFGPDTSCNRAQVVTFLYRSYTD